MSIIVAIITSNRQVKYSLYAISRQTKTKSKQGINKHTEIELNKKEKEEKTLMNDRAVTAGGNGAANSVRSRRQIRWWLIWRFLE